MCILYFIYCVIACLIISCNGEDFCSMLQKYQKLRSAFEPYLAQKDKLCGALYKATDCKDILTSYPSTPNGPFAIHPPDGQQPLTAFCDMTTDGGGWLVIQRREDGSEDFYRDWYTYLSGFGDFSREFWLGNEIINRLTSQSPMELRIDVEDFTGHRDFAKYTAFAVGDMTSFLKLSVSGFTGSSGDPLSSQDGMKFSAFDLDVDGNNATSCAKQLQGAWWYNNCETSNLNGFYGNKADNGTIFWDGSNKPLKRVVMMIRPVV